MLDQYQFHDMTLTWLIGGHTALDGGAMFGAVPKALWSKRYPVDEKNRIELPTDPILIQYQGKNYLIDASVGSTKLSDKQKQNYGVWTEPQFVESLAQLSLTPEDIDVILMTHCHFDHIGGLTINVDGKLVSQFPNAKILMTQIEWDELRNPNIRSRNTYWRENWEAIAEQVETFENRIEVVDGIEMIHTGGHSDGHAIIKLTQQNETILHMADLMATRAHQPVLWVMAYDDYPMTSVNVKQQLLADAYQNNTKFTFYHDAHYRLIQWDQHGKDIVFSISRTIEPLIK